MIRVLFVGESWFKHVQETKGYDVFTYDSYEEAHQFIQAALENSGAGIEFTHIPSHRVEFDFPTSLEDLKKYDIVMVSDCGANTFNLPMETFVNLKRSPNKLELIRKFVEDGGAFVMIGGYMTFQGIQARGAYKNTAAEEVLPIELLPYDDRIERCDGITPKVVMPDHDIVKGLADEQWPCLLGYNRLIPKKGSEVVAEINGDPMIVVGEYGKGRSCAYATDCAPHWSPEEFCLWDGYTKLWGNIAKWLVANKNQ